MPGPHHHPSLPLLLLLGLLLSLLALPVRAALVLHDDSPPMALLGSVDYFNDPTGELPLQALLASPERFHSSAGRRDLGFGYVDGAIWLRLQVESASSQARDWRLEIGYPSLDRVDLYDVGADGTRHSQAGDMLPFTERSVGNRNPVFDLHLQPGERRTLYLRASSEGSMTLDTRLYSRQAHEQHSIQGYVAQALYGGTLFALGCYNLLLFLALRERPFFYYVLFVSVFAIGILGLNGLGAQFLWPQAGWWTNRALPFSMNGAAAIGILFARSFLDTPKWLPRGDRWLRLAFVVVACGALANLLLPVQLALQIMSVSGIVMCLTLLGTGFVCLKNRVPGAGIFVLAWSMLLGGTALLGLRNFALIPSNFFTIHAMQIGSMLEMILLSFALAARFDELKRQKEQALQQQERQLEQRVTERTEALEEANRRLLGLAMKDPLTGLANRTALQTQLELAIRRSQRRQDLLAVMLIDLDGFKPINDQHGHALGDQVLAVIARRLQTCARDTDLPARLGGDEFVLVCEAISSPEHAEQVAQRMLEQISLPIELGQLTVQVGASIGIALSRGADSGTLLIRRADAAMYIAKANGRNRVQRHEATPS